MAVGSSGAVATVSPLATVSVKELRVETEFKSVAWNVSWNVPTCVGVPPIEAVDELKVRPVGKAPETRDQEYGGKPPDAVSAWD